MRRQGVHSILYDGRALGRRYSTRDTRDPSYVKASPVIEGIDLFDSRFFGIPPREANFLDPQQRFFLETAWTALEDAGCDPQRYSGSIGVYAGSGGSITSYLLACLESHPEMRGMTASVAHFGNDKDFLPPRTSYKLDLRGPSIAVQCACSTSLVSIHLACQALLSGECDMALAGGVNIRIPQNAGYLRHEGDIFSVDGHIRTFDENATGIVFGSGIGIVVLKPLEDAVRDGDRIYAVVTGSAVNNDGAKKVSYTASSMSGQVRCISEALAISQTDPDSISYLEAHGTGTTMGDQVEIAALSNVFPKTDSPYCAIGSVKTNVGHLDAAAGVTSFIKTALCLYHKKIPPIVNFNKVNPRLNLDKTPFYVNTHLTDWTTVAGTARRAGVNGLGIGGTNAFAVFKRPQKPKS